MALGIRGGLLQNITSNALGDALRRFMGRIVHQMRSAGRRLDIAVGEPLANHRQGRAERQGA